MLQLAGLHQEAPIVEAKERTEEIKRLAKGSKIEVLRPLKANTMYQDGQEIAFLSELRPGVYCTTGFEWDSSSKASVKVVATSEWSAKMTADFGAIKIASNGDEPSNSFSIYFKDSLGIQCRRRPAAGPAVQQIHFLRAMRGLMRFKG